MARIGYVACGCTGCTNTEAAVSETAAGTLSVVCHRCEFSSYAKPGTKAARLIRSAMVIEDEAPAPSPAQIKTKASAPAPAPTAPVKRVNSAFSLGNL